LPDGHASRAPKRQIEAKTLKSLFARTMAKGEPVPITQHGRPVVTMIDADLVQKAVRVYQAYDMAKSLDALSPLPDNLAQSDEDNNALVHALR